MIKTTFACWIRLGLLPVAVCALPGALAAADQTASSPGKDKETVMELEPFEVLGSRIRLTDVSGPSPVSAYSREEIAQTGAMTLADFLNRLPQNYNGVAAGRGSTPNELNPEFGSQTETSTPPINIATGAFAPPANATGQSGVSLRGLGSGATLVLVDGRRVAKSSVGNQGTDSRQGFVDLNTIPLGMVERVQVITDGASALYGADAVGGVINIILRKNWSGTEVTSTYKAPFTGSEGAEKTVSLIHGFSRGKLRGSASLDYYQRDVLKASDRPFSAGQDHSAVIKGYNTETGEPVYGTNYLLNWGYPATVQARSGNLSGILDPNGKPTRVALAPEGLAAMPETIDGFVGVAPTGTFPLADPIKARRGNTSGFLDLIPPSERKGAGLRLTYQLPNELELYGNLLYTESTGSSSGQPPAFATSATTGLGKFATIVPAAYNPFNQDVLVGMIAYGFGAVRQDLSNQAFSSRIGLTAPVGPTWRWDCSLAWQQQEFERVTRDFNPARITAALANPDPDLRVNPFTDIRAGAPHQSALWDSMSRHIRFDGSTEQFSVDFIADGELVDFRGDAIRMAAGFYYEDSRVNNRSATPSVEVTPVDTITASAGDGTGLSVFAELMVPVYGKSNARSGLERLDFQLALRHEDRGDAGNATVPKLGLSWVPVKSLLLRGGYSEGFRAPGPTETIAESKSFNNNSIIDPLRGNAVTTGVLVTREANPELRPETSTSRYFGILYEPAWWPGFTVEVNYYATRQEDIIQVLTEQVLVYNEASFPDRVIRAEPDADDIANDWPGQITGVNRSLVNFGRSENHSLDFNLRYQMPEKAIGKLQFNLSATHTLKATRELQPGVDAIDDLGDTYSPPEWRFNASVYWNYKKFNASLFAYYLSSFGSNNAGNFRANQPVPAQMSVDLRAGYEFSGKLIGNWGAGTRFSIGIGNLFDEQPPFADTVYGYNGIFHSPLGRNYQISVTIPF